MSRKDLEHFLHIKNVHTFPENKFFNQCEHGPLDKDARLKPWITEGDIIQNEYDQMCKVHNSNIDNAFYELNIFPSESIEMSWIRNAVLGRNGTNFKVKSSNIKYS